MAPIVLSPSMPSASPPTLKPNVDINTIVKVFIQATLETNTASIVANPPAPSPAPAPTQPSGGYHSSEKFFLKAWNGDLHSFLIFQGHIHAWFRSLSFTGFTNFTKNLPGTKHQSSLLPL